MKWLEVSVRCGREAVEAVADRLTDLAGGVAIDDPLLFNQGKDRGDWDYCDLEPGDPNWVTIKAYLPAGADLEDKRLRLEEDLRRIRGLGLAMIDTPRRHWVDEEEWADAWKQYFKPVKIGQRLVVVPSWEQYQLRNGDVPLCLDPGMAFGTGAHPTTALCLGWLGEICHDGSVVLDIGTGSGILAIAAAKLGATRVLALDTDAVAIRVAGENLEKNGVSDRVRLVRGDLTTALDALGNWLAQPQVTVANIVADAIIDLAPQVFPLMGPRGFFLCSGIITERLGQVRDGLEQAGFQISGVREEGGWVAVLAQKP
jgi:ribosomal protein L11 methyltransferase